LSREVIQIWYAVPVETFKNTGCGGTGSLAGALIWLFPNLGKTWLAVKKQFLGLACLAS